MIRIALSTAICACLLWPVAVKAQFPSHGIYSRNFFSAEYPKEPHPKKLEIALAITQRMVDSQGATLPLYFGFQYASARLETEKTKVTYQVKIYRGKDLLWKAKRLKKADEIGEHRYVHCKTYNKGLRPGDVVVFSYKFKKAPKPGKVGLIRLTSLAGPKEMWLWDRSGLWPLSESFHDCL